MADLVLRDLTRRYGSVVAADRVTLTVNNGEFVTLLGPSGCGKSTTLAMIAGLDRPDEGYLAVGERVFFDGASQRFVPAENRNLGLVFQSYALWPHMTVRDNVAFALKLRRVRGKQRDDAIQQALELVEMENFAQRYPHQLSGGQQQRVALARTLAYRPAILLLDEPLSNLDAKLRDRARGWLRRLQTEIGITTIFVTHDQTEALSLSDRIAVMRAGRIIQIGTPTEIYNTPADPFVADFVGTSNLVVGEVVSSDAEATVVRMPSGETLSASTGKPLSRGARASIFFRPERVDILPASTAEGENLLRARIVDEAYIGSCIQYSAETAAGPIRLESLEKLSALEVVVRVPREHAAVFAQTV